MVDVAHDGDHRRTRLAGRPGRPRHAPAAAISASSASARTAVWPSSSVTSTAVSWSMDWVMVAITPILNSALTTSPPFSASFWARSATVIASPIATSRTIGAVGLVKPVPERAWSWPRWRCARLGAPRPAPRRARSAALRCNWPAKRWARRRPRRRRPSHANRGAACACGPRALRRRARRRRGRLGHGHGGRACGAVASSATRGFGRRGGLHRAARSASSSAFGAWLRRLPRRARLSSSARRCCSDRLRCRDSSSLRRISARSSSGSSRHRLARRRP